MDVRLLLLIADVKSVTEVEVLKGEDATVTCVAIYQPETNFEPRVQWFDSNVISSSSHPVSFRSLKFVFIKSVNN